MTKAEELNNALTSLQSLYPNIDKIAYNEAANFYILKGRQSNYTLGTEEYTFVCPQCGKQDTACSLPTSCSCGQKFKRGMSLSNITERNYEQNFSLAMSVLFDINDHPATASVGVFFRGHFDKNTLVYNTNDVTHTVYYIGWVNKGKRALYKRDSAGKLKISKAQFSSVILDGMNFCDSYCKISPNAQAELGVNITRDRCGYHAYSLRFDAITTSRTSSPTAKKTTPQHKTINYTVPTAKDISPFCADIEAFNHTTQNGELNIQCNECGHIWNGLFSLKRRKGEYNSYYHAKCPHCGNEADIPQTGYFSKNFLEISETFEELQITPYIARFNKLWEPEVSFPYIAYTVEKTTGRITKYLYKNREWEKTRKQDTRWLNVDTLVLSSTIPDRIVLERISSFSNKGCEDIALYLADIIMFPKLKTILVNDVARDIYCKHNILVNKKASTVSDFLKIPEQFVSFLKEKKLYYPKLCAIISAFPDISKKNILYIEKNQISLEPLVSACLTCSVKINDVLKYIDNVVKTQYLSPPRAATLLSAYYSYIKNLKWDISDTDILYPSSLRDAQAKAYYLVTGNYS